MQIKLLLSLYRIDRIDLNKGPDTPYFVSTPHWTPKGIWMDAFSKSVKHM